VRGISYLVKSQNAIISSFKDYGLITSVTDGIIQVVGLHQMKAGELVYVGQQKVAAMILNLETKISKGILFGRDDLVLEGDIVVQANALVSVGVNSGLFGRAVDSLGNIIDGGSNIPFQNYYPVDVKAPGIISRKPVHESLPTGIKIIDSMLPIGNGQRELTIGDRQTGKTSIVIDTIINQQNNELQMACIYVGIGQKKSSVSYLFNKLREYKALNYTIFVLSGAADTAALQFLSPYSGCSIGE